MLVGLGVAEVKAVEPSGAVLDTGGNLIQLVFHGRGEVIVHQLGEVLLQQSHDGKGNPRWHQRIAARDHIAAVLDGLDNGRIRGRAADTQVLHFLDQAGLGIARRRVGGVALGGDLLGVQGATLFQMWQVGLALLVTLGVICAVGLQEAGEGNGAAGGGEFHIVAAIIRGSRAGHGDLHGGSLGIGHLGGDGALPNQVIELKLLRIQLTGKLARGGEGLASRADGLVGFLGVFHLAVINTRGIRNVLCAIDAGGGVARS